MNDAAFNGLRLDRGLTGISHAAAQPGLALPAQRQLDPAESLAAQHLDAMLGPRGLAAELESALVPEVSDRGLLLPGAFRSALLSARDALLQAAGRGADAAGQRLLQRAARALDEDLALRDLAAMYRGVLHQG